MSQPSNGVPRNYRSTARAREISSSGESREGRGVDIDRAALERHSLSAGSQAWWIRRCERTTKRKERLSESTAGPG
jgi:hypothetical protein